MEVERNHADKRVLNKEIGKNQPGSPKDVEHQRRIRQEMGHHTHASPAEKPEAPNTISEKRYPTNPFGE